MPQELVCVYYVPTGEPSFMHSVDAQEALRLGDYVSSPPFGKVDDAALARAMQRASGMGAASHPELQSPEERQHHRDEANAIEAHRVAVMAAQQAATLQVLGVPAPVPMVHGLAPEPQALDVTHSESVSAQAQADAAVARKR